MKRLHPGVVKVGGTVLAASFLLAGASCTESHKVKSGPPVLEKVQMLVAGAPPGAEPDLLHPDEMDPTTSFPPMTPMRAIFDRIIDGSKVETAMPGMPVQPVPGVATGSWSGMTGITLTGVYNPGGSLLTTPPGPAITFTPSPALDMGALAPSLPSGSKVMLKLDSTKIQSKAGEPFSGTDTFMIDTDPFTATLGVPKKSADGNDPGPSSTIKVSLNNFPSVASLEAGVKVTMGGATVMGIKVAQDANKPSFTISGPNVDMMTMGRTWDPGDYVVEITPMLADIYGVELGAAGAKMGMFTIGAGAGGDGGASDGGEADGGATDGGGTDGGDTDGGVMDGGDSDGATD